MKKVILITVLLFAILTASDTLRTPENQITARIYVNLVHVYQAAGRPLLEGIVACRFRPTCSEYSIQAVERYGLWKGLYLTAVRLYSCQNDVPMGTIDDVPS